MSPKRWQKFEDKYPDPEQDTDEDKFDSDAEPKDWKITFPLPVARLSEYQRNRFTQMARERLDPEVSVEFTADGDETEISFVWRPLLNNGYNRENEDQRRLMAFKTLFISELESIRNGKIYSGSDRYADSCDYDENSEQHSWEKTYHVDIKNFDDEFLTKLRLRAMEILGSEVSIKIEGNDRSTKILFEWDPSNGEDHVRFVRFNTWVDLKLKSLENKRKKTLEPKDRESALVSSENYQSQYREITFDVPIATFDYAKTNWLWEKARKMLDPKVVVKIEAIGNETKVSFEWRSLQNKNITQFLQLMTRFEEKLNRFTHDGEDIA